MQRYRDILRQYWGYDDFRGIQADIIASITSGRDTLGLMPTGGGKSITFQVPALAMEGMTIVVTPLIALMKDQVENLCRRGIRAAAIYSGQSHEEILKHLDNSIYGAYKLLYVSPERLATEIFRIKVQRMDISFITVDEAHCISQWGYDFRPAYLGIAGLRDLLPDVPVLALTATATPAVVDDICRQLRFRPEASGVFRMSFERKNLSYVVRRAEDKEAELLHILSRVGGSAIVYTRSRKGTTEVMRRLQSVGITAFNYHAGLSDIDKDVRQHAWQDGAVRVMVATNAFGMGIDKPDVRLVVHMDLPDSVEAYFQEAGRAGRDGKRAYAVLLYNNTDHGKMLRRIPETFPPREYVEKVYDDLAYYFQMALGDGEGVTREFSLERFCIAYKLFPVAASSALQLLARDGFIDYREEEENTSRLMFLTPRDELYRLRHIIGNTDAVMRAVLRLYAGVFSDYVYIDEQRIGLVCGLLAEEVYDELKLLSQIRILHYIPRKNASYITYTQCRVERAVLSQEVYEKRRDAYVERVNAILHYASSDDECRSRMLLSYFGEEAATDCGRCDVCLAPHAADGGLEDCIKALLGRIREHGSLPVPSVTSVGYSESVRAAAVERLVREGNVRLVAGELRLVEDSRD